MLVQAVNNKPVFKGLWGKEDIALSGNIARMNKEILKHYYPFKEETKKEIEEVVKKNTEKIFISWYETGGATVDSLTNVKVHQNLPFTKEEFDAYKNSSEDDNTSPSIRLVATTLSSLGLIKYLNKNKKLGFDFLSKIFKK